MPRLSILIAARGDIQGLEGTLVWVLQGRPSAAEIVVVLSAPYDDPYTLAGEVRFVQAPPGATLVECLNLGLRESTGAFVHVLACGAEVAEGWTDEPLRQLVRDPSLGAVASLVLDADRRQTVLSAGVGYRARGVAVREAPRRLVAGQGPHGAILGPSRLAAFYRRSILDALGGFAACVGDELFDVDLALSMRRLGFRAALELRSHVFARAEAPHADTSAPAQARRQERLFLRHAPLAGWLRSLSVHAPHVVLDSARRLPRPAALAALLGRAAAWCEWPRVRRHHRAIRQAARTLWAARVPPPAPHVDLRRAGQEAARGAASLATGR